MKRIITILLAVLIASGSVIGIVSFRESAKERKEEEKAQKEAEKEKKESGQYVFDTDDSDTDNAPLEAGSSDELTVEDSSVDQSYNYLSNVDALSKYFILEKGYLKLGKEFNDYATKKLKTYGDNFVIQNVWRADEKTVFSAEGTDSNVTVYVSYKPSTNRFEFYKELPDNLAQ